MENHSVEVSVIIPNYNYARFFQKAVLHSIICKISLAILLL